MLFQSRQERFLAPSALEAEAVELLAKASKEEKKLEKLAAVRMLRRLQEGCG